MWYRNKLISTDNYYKFLQKEVKFIQSDDKLLHGQLQEFSV